MGKITHASFPQEVGVLVAGIDIETNGLDKTKDEVTEIAWVIKEWGRPRFEVLRQFYIAIKGDVPPNITEITGIDKPLLEKYGHSLVEVMGILRSDLGETGCAVFVAHNGSRFDRPFLQEKITGGKPVTTFLDDYLWVDTLTDLDASAKLVHFAAEKGFINPFPHSALFDVMTMLRILDTYDKNVVLERVKSPWVLLKADVSYDNRDKAKARRFSWETPYGSEERYTKTWVKRVRECDVEAEVAQADFTIVRMK